MGFQKNQFGGTESTLWSHLVSFVPRTSNVDWVVTSFGISGKPRRSLLTHQPLNDCEPKQPNQFSDDSRLFLNGGNSELSVLI